MLCFSNSNINLEPHLILMNSKNLVLQWKGENNVRTITLHLSYYDGMRPEPIGWFY